jgi:hypothetical protein
VIHFFIAGNVLFFCIIIGKIHTMRYFYLGAVSCLFLLACSKKEASCVTAPQPLFIRFISPAGVDLLKPTNPGAYQAIEISLTYIDNGVGKNLLSSINPIPNTDTFLLASYPDGIARDEKDGRNFYIKLSSTDTDTCYVRYNKIEEKNGCKNYTLAEFRYNNVVYNARSLVTNYPSVFEIVKR